VCGSYNKDLLIRTYRYSSLRGRGKCLFEKTTDQARCHRNSTGRLAFLLDLSCLREQSFRKRGASRSAHKISPARLHHRRHRGHGNNCIIRDPPCLQVPPRPSTRYPTGESLADVGEFDEEEPGSRGSGSRATGGEGGPNPSKYITVVVERLGSRPSGTQLLSSDGSIAE